MARWALMVYVVASVVTFVAYGVDKRAARRVGGRGGGRRGRGGSRGGSRGGWRMRERDLHLLELLGGWPGALVGQVVFRHKWRKVRYMVVVVGIVILHVGVWWVVVWG